MTTPLSSISGIISGIQSRDLVEQIIQADRQPALRLLAQADTLSGQLDALKTYRTLVDSLKTAAQTLRDGTAFDGVVASSNAIAGTRAVVSATGSPSAATGTYRVAVTNLATAQKLGSVSTTDPAAALALTAGSFTLNGVSITVSANDTLASLRDKINVANTGSAPSKVIASILTVGTNDHRLVLTSETTGAAGIAIANVTGGAPEALGFTDASNQVRAAAVLVAGENAEFSVDGIAMNRASNTVTDVIQGVTLSLTAEEANAVTQVTIERSVDNARGSMQAFIDAYNKLVDFLKLQQTAPKEGGTRPPLYGEGVIRTASALLPRTLQTAIGGAAADLSTAGLAGVSLGSDGKLSLNAAKFDAAFRTRPSDLRTLFSQRGSATDPAVSYLGSSATTVAGTYAVNITQVATQAADTGTGFSGTYTDDGTPDIMRVTDLSTNVTAEISLTDGLTSAQIALALNTALAGTSLVASPVGSEIRLASNDYGNATGFTIEYVGGGSDSTAQLGLAAGTVRGADVAGTIGGHAATGSGRSLVGTSGTPVDGLMLSYTGTATGAAGDVTLTIGTGALIERALDNFVAMGTGTISAKETALNTRRTNLENRAGDIEARLELRRAALLRQFAGMEVGLARLQSQSRGILAALGAMTQANN